MRYEAEFVFMLHRRTCRTGKRYPSVYLDSMKHVSSAKVNHSTCDAVVCYEGSREVMITALRRFHYETADVPESYLENSGRQVNEEYKEKLVDKV